MSSLSTCTVGNDEHGNLYGYSSESEQEESHTPPAMVVYPEFAQLLKDKLKDLPDISQTLCVRLLQKGREAVPNDEHNHINFLVSQDPNFDPEVDYEIVMVDWKKPWYLKDIYDWTYNGEYTRLFEPKTEEYPKRYCPLHMDAALLKRFYTEFDCGIGVTNIKERFQLADYEWDGPPRSCDADCRLVRVSEKKRSAPTPNAESQCTKKQKVDEDGSAKEPLTGVALWKKKVKDVMCDSYGNEAHLVEVMEVLNKAKEANFPIDVEGFLGTWEGNNMNVLNSILYDSYYNGNDEQDINDLKKLLSMSKNWKRYWDREDKVFNSPLSWIEEKDEEAAIKLLPFFKKHGHIIDIRERNILGKNVLAEWDKLNNTDPE